MVLCATAGVVAMARKIIVQTPDGSSPVLEEIGATDEAQLQELIKDNPDLLPVEEFGMTGPLLVVGRETSLPSGAVDLVALARSGELLVIEFKTGPQNTDFRQSMAQLLDYGSDLWTMSYEDFESTVPTRYFASDRCRDKAVRGLKSLQAAASATWKDVSDEEMLAIRERLSEQLRKGSFHYVLVAQRFTHSVERAIDYLNATMSGARFYAVEIVRFHGEALSAFESRTVLKPTRPDATRVRTSIDEEQFFDGVHEEAYRRALHQLFEVYRGLGLRFEWGSAGVSIRLPTVDRPEPLTIAWVFPPGRAGWMDLTDLTLGFDPWSANRHPSTASALEQYLASIRALGDVQAVKSKNLHDTAYHVPPPALLRHQTEVAEILAELVRKVNNGGE